MRHTAILLCLFATTAPGQTASSVENRNISIRGSKLIDLTYSFDEHTIYWPTSKPFEWRKDSWGRNEAGEWYASASFCTSEHGGTHLDSPIHFAEGRWSSEQIPVSRLIAPAVVIDVSAAARADRNYRLTRGDIEAWERRHGRIPDGSIVLVRTGWGRHWPDRKEYLGTDKPGDVAGLSFPGIHPEAARLLARERTIYGVGIDTASLDYGPSKDFAAHRVLNEANIYGLENVANLEQVPEAGATLIALPVKVAQGTGGPVRIVAVVP
ncbi:MAG: cyclase family protein [Bryobacteraceae bacterium]